jgi:uncharacterized protein GlcG (DUF336 family)
MKRSEEEMSWKSLTLLRLTVATLSLSSFNSAVSQQTTTLPIPHLKPEVANRIVVAAIAECDKRGYQTSAAVVGRDGNLLAFLRSPLSGPHTVETSQRKAYTAASLQAPTSRMQSRPDLSFAPGMLLIVGGVPICAAGSCYGGVAVAGADPAIDEKCAEAGIAAVQDDLEFGSMR